MNLLNFKRIQQNQFLLIIFLVRKIKLYRILRDVGSQFTINKMLTFDSVKTRLEREQSLSYMEFNYMILQRFS